VFPAALPHNVRLVRRTTVPIYTVLVRPGTESDALTTDHGLVQTKLNPVTFTARID